jgi:hypothetical protein
VIVGNILDHNRDGRNKVCLFHHGVMMLIGRLIVMGRLCELHVLLLVDSTWDTFFYRIRFFYTVARVLSFSFSLLDALPLLKVLT